MRSWTVVSASLAPVALIGGWTLAQSRQPPGFSAVTDTISALAALDAQDRWIMTSALVVLGGCHLATAAGLTEARPAGRAMLALGGVATVAVAALPQPNAGHFPAATTAFVALAAWPVLALVPSRTAAVVATVVLGALDLWLVVELPRETIVGLTERVAAGAQALWPLATALLLRRRSRARARG